MKNSQVVMIGIGGLASMSAAITMMYGWWGMFAGGFILVMLSLFLFDFKGD